MDVFSGDDLFGYLFYNVKTRGRKCLTYDVVTMKAKIINYTIN